MTIKPWRERAGLSPAYELHNPSTVEKAMQEEIAELRAQRWISVGDRLPEFDTYVLVFGPHRFLTKPRHDVAALSPQGSWWSDALDDYCPVEVTHWMPLPQAPATE